MDSKQKNGFKNILLVILMTQSLIVTLGHHQEENQNKILLKYFNEHIKKIGKWNLIKF